MQKKRLAMIRKICFMFFAALSISCSDHFMRDEAKLKALDAIIEDEPIAVHDSLDSIRPEKLNRENRAYYHLLHAYATGKVGQEESDTVLLKLRIYYDSQNDLYNLARTEYLLGLYLSTVKEVEESFRMFKSAENHLNESRKKNLSLLGRIYYWLGQIQNLQFNLPEAQLYFGKSVEIFTQIKDSISIVYSLRQIGGINQEQGNYSEALKNFKHSIEITQQIKDEDKSKIIDAQASIENLLCRFYLKIGDYSKALESGKKCIWLLESNSQKVPSQYYLNIINVLKKMTAIDSIKYYCQKMLPIAEKEGNYFNLLNGYKLLYQIEEMQNNYQEACKLREIHNQLKDEQNKQNKAEELIRFEKKYNMAKKDKEILSGQNKNLRMGIFSSAALIIGLLLIVYLKTMHRRLQGKYKHLFNTVKNIKWGFALSRSLLTNNYNAYDELEQIMNRHKTCLVMPAFYDEFLAVAQQQKSEYIKRIFAGLVNVDNDFIQRMKSLHPDLDIEDIMLAAMLTHRWELNEISEVLRIKREALKKRILRLKIKLATQNMSDDDFLKLLQQI